MGRGLRICSCLVSVPPLQPMLDHLLPMLNHPRLLLLLSLPAALGGSRWFQFAQRRKLLQQKEQLIHIKEALLGDLFDSDSFERQMARELLAFEDQQGLMGVESDPFGAGDLLEDTAGGSRDLLQYGRGLLQYGRGLLQYGRGLLQYSSGRRGLLQYGRGLLQYSSGQRGLLQYTGRRGLLQYTSGQRGLLQYTSGQRGLLQYTSGRRGLLQYGRGLLQYTVGRRGLLQYGRGLLQYGRSLLQYSTARRSTLQYGRRLLQYSSGQHSLRLLRLRSRS